MNYITASYYSDTFHGTEIPSSDFNRLAEAASETIYSVCLVKPSACETRNAEFKKAVCYQTEMLYQQGGIDAITGFSAASAAGGSESLGDYSVSSGSAGKAVATAEGGVPVSPLALQILKRLGLMSRWAYAGCFDHRR